MDLSASCGDTLFNLRLDRDSEAGKNCAGPEVLQSRFFDNSSPAFFTSIWWSSGTAFQAHVFSLLDLVNSARHDYVLQVADRLRSGICKQLSSLVNKDPVAYNYINNALAEARTLGRFADVVACLSPAYASIDADRQPAPMEHALEAFDSPQTEASPSFKTPC